MGLDALLVMNAVGTAVSVAGQIKAGKDQQAAHDYNAQVADRNAEAERINARRVEFLETKRIEDFREQYEDFANSQRMIAAKNGFSADTGTPLALQIASRMEAETEIANNIYNVKLGKQAREQAALNQELDGRLSRMAGQAARSASMIGAGQSLLSGGTNMYRINRFG